MYSRESFHNSGIRLVKSNPRNNLIAPKALDVFCIKMSEMIKDSSRFAMF
jgi:hypothetical protein